MKIAAAYIRVSTDDQLEYSPDSQLEKIREYAAQNGMALPEEFIFREEEGISGRAAKKRPEFMRMIGTAKKKPKPFDVILVWKFSRFARSRQDSIVYKSMLRRQCGIDVVSVTEPVGDDKMSILVEAMIEAMDEYYSINLAEEVRRGMNEKVARGEPVTIPAFGYLIKDKKYLADPETAPLVRMVFRDFIGGTGCRGIAMKLNAMGVRTRRGGRWENRTVEYLLRNPVYIGKIRWNPAGRTRRNYGDPNVVIVEGGHEPLIDAGTWKRTQERIEKNKLLYGRSAGAKASPAYALQGLVKCGSCGSSMTRASGDMMQCLAYSHGRCGVSHGVTYRRLEAMVLAAVGADLKRGDILIAPKTLPEKQEETQAVERLMLRERQKLLRAQEAFEDGVDSLAEYRENKQKITACLKRLQSEIAAFKARAEAPPPQDPHADHRNVMAELEDPSIGAGEKNELLRSFVEKIVFDKADNRIQVFYYV